jgi:phosphoribosylformimino-5-aminoimidazole carboxamide ribotide isomerase
VSRVILGTAAVRDPDLVRRACREFPDQIAVGIDAREGRVAVEGWVQSANITASELVKLFEDAGVAAVIYTDISRDGTGSGINVDETVALANGTSIPVIASGGVGSLADIRAVKNAGLPGVIVGKAFYNKSVDPKEALEASC